VKSFFVNFPTLDFIRVFDYAKCSYNKMLVFQLQYKILTKVMAKIIIRVYLPRDTNLFNALLILTKEDVWCVRTRKNAHAPLVRHMKQSK